MGILGKINASTLIIILVISIITTIVVLQYEPEEYQNQNQVNLMENERLAFVEGIDPDNDSKYEYISFGIEITLIEKGYYTLEIACTLGEYISDTGRSGRILSIDDYIGYQNNETILVEYVILTSYFSNINLVNFTILLMGIISNEGKYDSVESLGFHEFDLSQIDLTPPYDIFKMELSYDNDSESKGFESAEFNFTVCFNFPILLEFELDLHFHSYNTFDYYAFSDNKILNITEPQLFPYYVGYNFTDLGRDFTYVKSIYIYFSLKYAYDIRMELISDTIYYGQS